MNKANSLQDVNLVRIVGKQLSDMASVIGANNIIPLVISPIPKEQIQFGHKNIQS